MGFWRAPVLVNTSRFKEMHARRWHRNSTENQRKGNTKQIRQTFSFSFFFFKERISQQVGWSSRIKLFLRVKWQERCRLIEHWELDRNRGTKKAKTQLIIEPTSDATEYEEKLSWQ